ncbi:PKD domain containing protein [Desulfobulbus propionicus DSM 2032]|uniref:PKD domain containing protein n=1 Tax=Desulfobulbus propionicus (strain ATCC 33891 / DSM 2032 / VKM B-1956 / 1pr3) TaxID=577650 RepID=A0A7U3YJM7_DESPD|nr:PKD domain-containing protein [Desulfobulbus propionicus]ADW16540.1 PKD domain containing protein [Desulfobulbus propionicus DSM 2032]
MKTTAASTKVLHAATLVLFLTTMAPPSMANTGFSGSLKGVAITDAQKINKPPVALFTYTKNGDIYTFDASGASDSDGSIVSYIWDFGDGVKDSGITVTHSFEGGGISPVTLTIVDNSGGVTMTQENVSLASPVQIAINFQPASAPVPTGFTMDSGSNFDDAVGYGWVSPPAAEGTRDRNSLLSPDQSFDTLIHVAPTAVWEHIVPNGKYLVTVTVGDPSAPDRTQGVQVEGAALITAERLSSLNPWITREIITTVTDNRLSLTFQTSDTAKLCWVKIVSQ